MSDYYTESQMQRIEQAAYDGAMLEAGKEWERQRYEFGATEAELAERVTELEAEVTKCHELQDSYCDRPIEDALRAERDRAREMVTRLIETGRLLCDYAILVSFDHPMGDGQMALNDKSAWDALVTEWQKERETC